jgi:CBS-domain-containing membrane protein
MRQPPSTRSVSITKRARKGEPPAELVKRALQQVKVGQVMSGPVACPLRADLDSIEGLFLQTDAQALVVIDEDGVPCGVITKTDLVVQHFAAADAANYEAAPLEANLSKIGSEDADETEDESAQWGFQADDEQPCCKAVQLMSPQVTTVDASQSLLDALEIIEHEQVFTLPVVDESATLVGMLSARDLVDWLGDCIGAGRRMRPWPAEGDARRDRLH